MIIKKLEVAGLRAFEQAELEFHPGMNLLVGVNGVGKTTVLDALRICLSRVHSNLRNTAYNARDTFSEDDIRIGANSLKVSCDFEHLDSSFNFLTHIQREDYLSVVKEDGSEEVINAPNVGVFNPENLTTLFPNSHKAREQPLVLFFSTRRSFFVNQNIPSNSMVGGQASAFREALSSNRNFNIQEIAYWMEVQQALSEERPLAKRHLEVLKKAAAIFLPTCSNLRIDGSSKGGLLIDKEGKTLKVLYLSDGEKSMLTLALDLARRLSQANPELDDPATEGNGVILIDELDLHLHPKWQRTIVDQLTTTFPNCQFIATTHSPQIIPSVEPEQVLLIKEREVIHPNRTLGLDSNWILKFIMETEERSPEASEAMEKVENLIKAGNFKAARETIATYKESPGFDLPEWSIFEARMAKMEIFKKGK